MCFITLKWCLYLYLLSWLTTTQLTQTLCVVLGDDFPTVPVAAVIVVVVLIIVVVVVVVVVLRRRRGPAIESKYYTTLLYVSSSYYSASASLIGEPSIVMSEYVCLFVCPSVRDHIPGTTSSNFTTFFAHLFVALARFFCGGIVVIFRFCRCLHGVN